MFSRAYERLAAKIFEQAICLDQIQVLQSFLHAKLSSKFLPHRAPNMPVILSVLQGTELDTQMG